MANLELKYKAQVVDRILGCHAEFRESFGFHCYRLEDLQYGYPVEKVSFVIHQLFQDKINLLAHIDNTHWEFYYRA